MIAWIHLVALVTITIGYVQDYNDVVFFIQSFDALIS